MKKNTYYFGSGPAAMPREVLETIASGVLHIGNEHLSILEIPHRGALFTEMIRESEELVLSLLELSKEEYEVCWMQGGGRTLFATVPMNFLADGHYAAYIDSGHWSAEAANFASFYGKAEIIASSRSDNYNRIPRWESIPDAASYLHITTNNTLYGTQYYEFPETKIPIVADMTSEIFGRKIDYSHFDLMYAAAQKNVGPAGVVLVVAKKDFLKKQVRNVAPIFSFKELFAAHSAYNTPPVFAIYSSLIYLRWTAQQGMDFLARQNEEKTTLLYQTIDGSSLFSCPVEKGSRSLMNVCFTARNQEVEEAFIQFAASKNISGIQGHRSVGGFRIALYNAISLSDVQYLVETIKQFEKDF